MQTDKVHPSSKPTTTGSAAAAAPKPLPATKPNLYNPIRHPYRPQSTHNRRRSRRSGRSLCCCCCFWSILLILLLALLAATASAALYVLYRPHRPTFSLTSLRIHRLHVTTSPDSAASHLSSLLNLTFTSRNPNSHLTFFYDPFFLSASSNSVFLANGSVPSFTSFKKNETILRSVLAGMQDLDADSVTSLRSDLKKENGFPLEIQMDTTVRVKIGGVKSKKVGIRVTCEGIKGTAPKGKSPSVASVSDSKCKVDLRIKIWKWTF